jgi:hypothetical protein
VVVGGGTASNGASEINLAGTNSASNLHAVRKLFTYDDQVAICRGVHQLEAGVWLERLQANDNLAQINMGRPRLTA